MRPRVSDYCNYMNIDHIQLRALILHWHLYISIFFTPFLFNISHNMKKWKRTNAIFWVENSSLGTPDALCHLSIYSLGLAHMFIILCNVHILFENGYPVNGRGSRPSGHMLSVFDFQGTCLSNKSGLLLAELNAKALVLDQHSPQCAFIKITCHHTAILTDIHMESWENMCWLPAAWWQQGSCFLV